MPAPSIRIDWQRVALNLRSHGIQLQAASRRLGKHAGWLGQMAREEIGRGVEFHDGLRLLDYHPGPSSPLMRGTYSPQHSATKPNTGHPR